MATRFYLTSRMPNVNLQGAPLGDWSAGDSDRDNRGVVGTWTLLLNDTKTNGGLNSVATVFGASVTKTDNQPIIGRRWVTPPLQAVTLSGTLQLCIEGFHANSTGDTAFLQVYAYITVGDTLTERTVLIDNFVDPTDMPVTTPTWFGFTSAQAVAGAVLTGDRIVVEVGAVCSPDDFGNDNAYRLYWGTTNSSLVTLTDATAGDTVPRAAWVEFSDAISLVAAPAAPVNDACADATVISSVPFVSAVTDTTTSADTGRAVWWEFTPSASGWYFASTMGSNNSTDVSVFTGGCGGLNAVAGGAVTAWLSGGQSVCPWEATSGVSYLIKVTDLSFVSGIRSTVTAKDSGGSLTLSVYPQATPAEIDDLVVNCQHVATIRNGQIVNITDRFYGFTPTASAIDYTLRPMDDFNGGQNISRRLYVALFGTTPIIEIVDLETLNADPAEDEIDFMLDAIDTGGENLSSLVFSANATGFVYLGFYGDEYTVQGGTPSSAASSAVRFLDATHADGQAGAPWALADEWNLTLQNQGSDFIDLAANQETLYYTSAGDVIFSLNVATGVQGSNVALVPDAPGPRPGLRGLRTLPPGDGSSGWLVTAGSVAYWIGPLGTILQTYTPSPAGAGQDLDKIEITNDGQKFWVSDQYSTYLFQFDITTGQQLTSVNLNFPAGQLSGFSIVNGYRASTGTEGNPETPPEPPPEPSPYLGFATELPIRWVLRTPVIT